MTLGNKESRHDKQDSSNQKWEFQIPQVKYPPHNLTRKEHKRILLPKKLGKNQQVNADSDCT